MIHLVEAQQSVELNPEMLLTVAGNALFIGLMLQLLIKPLLNKWLADKRKPDTYGIVLNLTAVFIGVVGAILAQAIFGLDYESAFQAFLIGIGGAAVAVFGYETSNHAVRVMKKKHNT